MATVGQQLLAPESGWRRYGDEFPLIKLEGNWINQASNNLYGGYAHYSVGNGNRVKLVFKGTKFRIIAPYYTNKYTNVEVKIDGKSEYFNQLGVLQYTRLVYEKTGLEDKYHYVEVIIPDTTTGQNFQIEAVDIESSGELIRYDYFENTHLDEPMRKYGVAWFGFDEASGNVYDKLGGNYVGTVTGATRVDSWNGEGKSLEFIGNKNIQLNGIILPNDKLTIRFKIKKTIFAATNQWHNVFSTRSSDTKWGILAFFAPGDNQLGVYIVNNGQNYTILSGKNLLDGYWHDVMINYDNTKSVNNFNIYVDDEYMSSRTLPLGMTIGHGRNLVISSDGAFTSNVALYGQLDDFQVFSKALTPSDFTQKRVAIKTANNTTLVLPNKVGRVKEIPSIDETDLINQGYAWREIDDAVDAQAIDLTQATTEYEKVSKANVSLGSGKMFTIPLPNDFKKIKVENNY